ncbi:NitT/TauT family transport system permease protein [Azospirillum brasilense]|uniref:NitT/TauT family transport system permease protein n=1 Tax=Azospirillum brasilense TaxID=192 RepID=A0A560CDY4_AZOBR|nr:ABC transporter permease subunit [Azospirillum brasilense]MBK3736702.1 ABC transporter permease subunit [Azospirillum brasilense]TWA83064.1 NitT/TauT family transport system permease protein [Azospirillum brasilense]
MTTVHADAILDRLGRVGQFLWSGWAGLAGLALFAALWQAGHERYGDFILPAPLATLAAGLTIAGDPAAWELAGQTTLRAVEGFALAALAGAAGGLAAGYSPATMRLARPILTVLLGVPPIAWIVLAMIWFGSTDGTIITTVLVAATPVVFVGVAEGAVTRDRGLDDMARAFGAGPLARLTTLGLRHVAAFLFPALTVALGSAFKVAVMAELLANTGGIGGALAAARANLDVAEALAWVLIAVAGLIVVEHTLVHPIRSEFERWRNAARPWGVKR